MDVAIADNWKKHLQEEFEKDYFKNLVQFVKHEYRNYKVFPKGGEIFRAFDLCDFEKIKVVIIGQDPYHGEGQAHGLCFSVNDHVKMPPSLINIFKEIRDDLGKPFPQTGNLERWARQGVLLLNATLTVRAHKPGSHQQKGWEPFTDKIIELINQHKENVVFMLWGGYAKKKAGFVDTGKHLVLKATHPSPYSANNGFFGCRHFSKANDFLISKGYEPIEW